MLVGVYNIIYNHPPGQNWPLVDSTGRRARGGLSMILRGQGSLGPILRGEGWRPRYNSGETYLKAPQN